MKQKSRKMAFLPVLLDMVDEIYTSMDDNSKTFSDGFPLLFVPQRTESCETGKHCKRGQRDCPRRRFMMRKCGDGPCNKQASDDFKVSMDVKLFKPEEVSVKVKDRQIIVEGKHEERQDEIGFVSSQFSRRFIVPEEFDLDTVSTCLSAEGKLTIKAEKPKPAVESSERVIPIQRLPSSVEEKPVESDEQKKVEPSAAEEPKE